MMRRYLVFGLCLVMVLTSQTMAVARGAAGPAGTMVLCTGGGPVTILVDEDGAPVEGTHVCPDCLAHALTAILASDPAVPTPARAPRAHPQRVAICPDVPPLHFVQARGPPLTV